LGRKQRMALGVPRRQGGLRRHPVRPGDGSGGRGGGPPRGARDGARLSLGQVLWCRVPATLGRLCRVRGPRERRGHPAPGRELDAEEKAQLLQALAEQTPSGGAGDPGAWGAVQKGLGLGLGGRASRHQQQFFCALQAPPMWRCTHAPCDCRHAFFSRDSSSCPLCVRSGEQGDSSVANP